MKREVPAALQGCSLAIGNFDGIHLGHQALIGASTRLAREAGIPSVVLTFTPHTLAVLRPGMPVPLLTPGRERQRLVEDLGVDRLVEWPFTPETASLPPGRFILDILWGVFRPRDVWIGENFRFGEKGTGDPGLLRDMGQEAGFVTHVVPSIRRFGAVVSSSRIRESLRRGEVERAMSLLGRPYRMEGQVVGGDRRGRLLGFPTANLRFPPEKLLPGDGVYAVRVQIPGGQSRGGMANLGLRPTVDGANHVFEVHIFDFAGDLYGQTLRVDLVGFLRHERRFATVDDLLHQLRQDRQEARTRLAGPW